MMDSSRFHSQAMCLVGCLSEFVGVIMGRESNEREWERIRELNINVIEVQTIERCGRKAVGEKYWY